MTEKCNIFIYLIIIILSSASDNSSTHLQILGLLINTNLHHFLDYYLQKVKFKNITNHSKPTSMTFNLKQLSDSHRDASFDSEIAPLSAVRKFNVK